MSLLFFHAKWARETSHNQVHVFNLDKVFFTPVGRRSSVKVFIGSRAYAGFDSEAEAREAVALWKQHWPAAKTITFTVVHT